MKNDLQEECFKILHPEERKTLTRQLDEIAESHLEFQNTAVLTIDKLLREIDVPHKVDFRVKTPYSIFKKMKRKNIDHPKDLYDIYGIRIVVPTVADCYRVL